MDFQARQYEPQLGRLLGVDPMADAGGQQTLSPYAAMGNMPESMVDPNGEPFGGAMPYILRKDYGNAADPMGDISPTINEMLKPMGGTWRSGGGSMNVFNNWGTFAMLSDAMKKAETRNWWRETTGEAMNLAGGTVINYKDGNATSWDFGILSAGYTDDPKDDDKKTDSKPGYSPPPKDGLPGFPEAPF